MRNRGKGAEPLGIPHREVRESRAGFYLRDAHKSELAKAAHALLS